MHPHSFVIAGFYWLAKYHPRVFAVSHITNDTN